MDFKRIVVFLISSFLFGACAPKEYVTQNAAFIMFSTPTFKYADMGFIYENEEATKIEIYASGQALMSLEIREKAICMSLLECMSKRSFNERVLSGLYPEDTVENIFRGTAIFDGLGMKKSRNGFTQEIIKNNQYAILYSVFNKQILFRDTINNITIKVKK
jgi:hypothetical protein